jgi:integrase
VQQDGKVKHLDGGQNAAELVRVALRGCLSWAVRQGHLEANPCASIEPVAASEPRMRVLSDVELREVLLAARQIGFPFGSLIELLILSGQRRSEVAGMRWDQIDADKRLWKLPASAMKSKRPHVVPLSEVAIELLKGVPRSRMPVTGGLRKRAVGQQFVFGFDGSRPLTGFAKGKATLDKLLGDRVAPWTIHDVRRTCASGMASLGVAEFIVGKVLGHAAEGLTAKVYNQFDYAKEKAEALEKWGQHIAKLSRPPMRKRMATPSASAHAP